MYGSNPFDAFFSLYGIFGFVILFIGWVLGTILTGYIFGLGVWSAMPSELKAVIGEAYRKQNASQG